MRTFAFSILDTMGMALRNQDYTRHVVTMLSDVLLRSEGAME